MNSRVRSSLGWILTNSCHFLEASKVGGIQVQPNFDPTWLGKNETTARFRSHPSKVNACYSHELPFMPNISQHRHPCISPSVPSGLLGREITTIDAKVLSKQ